MKNPLQDKILYLVAFGKVALKSRVVGLTEWESKFWKSNKDRLKKGEPLSKAQWAVLGRMERSAINRCNYLMQETPEIVFKESAIEKYKWQIGKKWVKGTMPKTSPTISPDIYMKHLDGIEEPHGQ